MTDALRPDSLLSPVPGGLAVSNALAMRATASIKGATIGFLGNLKPNCDVLLKTLQSEAERLGASRTLFREKTSCSLGAAEPLLDEIAQNCQLAVVALGD